MNIPMLSSVDVSGKRVLLRAGFDVPLEGGIVQDDTRIRMMVPTVEYVLSGGGSLIIVAHQGRPTDAREAEFSQKPVAQALAALIGKPVLFVPECRGEAVRAAAAALKPGEVLMLENLRYEEAEASKDASLRATFAAELAALADMYVNDAFTNCHRDHASMTGVPALLPSYAGLQLEQEITHLSAVTENPEHPVTLIISGAKMETKVPVIREFLSSGDHVLTGGCIANTFLAAEGVDIGASKMDEEYLTTAQDILLESEKTDGAIIHVPVDAAVASEISASAQVRIIDLEGMEDDAKIADAGPKTAANYADVIAGSKTIIWNGPLGVSEFECFAESSKTVAQAMVSATKDGAVTVIGGGDTTEFLERYGFDPSAFTFVSTGGGAMLEFISGKKLPAIEALRKR